MRERRDIFGAARPSLAGLWDQGVFRDTRESPPLYAGVSLWESLFVVSQKWIPFPTALIFGLENAAPGLLLPEHHDGDLRGQRAGRVYLALV